MHFLFEESDILNTPVECFIFDTTRNAFPIKPHWHYFIEIIYMLEGTAQMNADMESFIAAKGDMVVFHSQSIHSIYPADSNPIRYSVLKFDINTLNLTSVYIPKLRSIFKSAYKKKCPVFFPARITERFSFGGIFKSCIEEMENRRYGFDLIIKSKLYELILNIIRYWQENGFVVESEVFAEEDELDIASITEYIDEHLSDGISVSEAAEKCKLSYSCFAKKFSTHYGMSCKEYIELMRIYKVEEMLLFTDFDLSFIAQETGFCDCSHMIKSFKAHRNVTPKQFRIQRQKR